MKGGLKHKMEQEEPKKPSRGTWDNLPTEQRERKPKVDFQINIPVECVFQSDDPVEMEGETGAYYIFDVKVGDEDKVVMTSAWSLLGALKTLTPLTGKRIKITKELVKGKQHFKVEDMTVVKI